MYIGCHLSSSNGFMHMGREAASIGANTFQYFTRNPRGGAVKALNVEDIKAFNEFARENSFGYIVAHAPYTLNPCSADEKTREFALTAMKEDLERMNHLDRAYYNFHPGSHVKQGIDVGIELICNQLNTVLNDDIKTTVLLETMAGKGSEVGRTFEELKRIIDGTQMSEKVGVCLDTCHVFDGGYDIVNDLDSVLEEFDKILGIGKLKAVHLNDSKNTLGSRKDRHEKIGEGNIGFEAFERIVTHSALRDLPFVLETPNELDGYAKEIALLRGMQG